jgi:pyoverdine/dityrosine biosynthesis protein Dit1
MPSAVALKSAMPPPLATGKMTPTLLLQPAKLDEQALQTASQILGVIYRYRLSHRPTPKSDEGDLKFLAQIYSKVKAGRLINMCLPAFPFKSPNSTTKVLGRLPDKAEELALAHLDGLCDAIKNIYPPGSELTIISDGLVYNGKGLVTL